MTCNEQSESGIIPCSRRFPFNRVTISGRAYYRLEYRVQSDPEYCVSNRVMLVGLSASYPEKPYGFTWCVSVCEQSLNQYSAERQGMLNSFVP